MTNYVVSSRVVSVGLDVTSGQTAQVQAGGVASGTTIENGGALNLTPGPDMLYTIARSAGEGRSAGVLEARDETSGSAASGSAPSNESRARLVTSPPSPL